MSLHRRSSHVSFSEQEGLLRPQGRSFEAQVREGADRVDAAEQSPNSSNFYSIERSAGSQVILGIMKGIASHFPLLGILVVVLLAASLSGTSVEGLATSRLKVGFYSNTACRNVETVVRAEVEKEYTKNPSIVALLLRMYFHDCFADGKCDASLLIKKNSGFGFIPTELDSGSNEGIRGLDFIDYLKRTVVLACDRKGDIVSCADIIALATRDAVALASKRAPYELKTGRLDGTESLMTNADTLPSPGNPISAIVARFEKAGFSPGETVILSGAHTVGEARCKFFSGRLSEPDPSLNATTLASLKKICQAGGEKRAFLDQGPGSAFKVDKSYFVMLTQHNGVLQSDQDLLTDPQTKDFVQPLADGSEDNFATQFEEALKKMGNLGSFGASGNIRKMCSVNLSIVF
ncbi:hypothetical protein M758_2G145300 [Ceratodon purpureus]|nr:hypothetical protein M758_2G145300 [Ceratodon purpureus]